MFVPNIFTIEECLSIISLGKNFQDASNTSNDFSIIEPKFLFKDISFDNNSEWFIKKIASFVEKFNRKYFNFILDDISGFKIIGLRTNEKIPEHVDLTGNIENSRRKITIIVNLSQENIFKGGNIQLKNIRDKVPNSTGSIVIFPSYIPYKIEEVTSGTKFMLILWAYGLSFR